MWDKTAFQAAILFRLRELEKKKTVPKVSQSMKRWDREMGQLCSCPPVSFDRSNKRTERTSLAPLR